MITFGAKSKISLNTKNLLTGIAYIVASLSIAWMMLRNILFRLGSTQLDMSGDGFKNYFTFAYQYRYGEGMWFEGMQYPYGDLVSYGDAQPLFVFLLKALKYVGLDITGHELLVLQSAPVIGLLIAALVLHKLIRTWDIPLYWTIPTVIFCLALSPQLFRFNSHYGLAYLFCIPLSWYLVRCYNKKVLNTVGFVSLATAFLFACGMIHPYHLLISSLFIMAYWLVNSVDSKRINVPILASAILPLLAFFVFNQIIDPYDDRPANPYGIWDFKTEMSDLLPFDGPIRKGLRFLPNLRDAYREGYAYPGFLLFLSPLIVFLAFKKRRSIMGFRSLVLYGLAGILCLLFAMGLHLVLTDGAILELLKPLKQFRGLGRFAWTFYYTSFIVLSIFLFRVTGTLKNKKLASAIRIITLIIWGVEAWFYTDTFNKSIQPYITDNRLVNDTRINDLLVSHGIRTSDYQCIMPLPVPAEGAEKFILANNWFVKMATFPFSFQSSLPMMGAYMSRISLSRMMLQEQASSRQPIPKPVIQDLNDKDLLVVIASSDTSAYSDLLHSAYAIGQLDELLVYGLEPDSLYLPGCIEVQNAGIDSCLYYNSFDTLGNIGMLGNGALQIEGEEMLAEIKSASFQDSLEFSFWFRVQPERSTVPALKIEFYNDRQLISHLSYRDNQIKRMDVFQPWMQMNYSCAVPDNTTRILWNISCDYLLIDHVLVREKDQPFYATLNQNYAINGNQLVCQKNNE